MSTEFKIQSVSLPVSEELLEQLVGLITALQSYSPPKKKRKRRKQKEKKTVGPLIQEIIDSIEI